MSDNFEKYEMDKIFQEIMKRINNEVLKEEDFQYITDYDQFREEFLVHERSVYKNAWREGNEEGKEIGKQIGKQIGREEGKEIGKQIGREEGKEIGHQEATFEFIKVLSVEFESIAKIARFTRLTVSQVQQYMRNIPDKETFELIEKQWNEYKNIQDVVRNTDISEGTIQRIVTYILDYKEPQESHFTEG